MTLMTRRGIQGHSVIQGHNYRLSNLREAIPCGRQSTKYKIWVFFWRYLAQGGIERRGGGFTGWPHWDEPHLSLTQNPKIWTTRSLWEIPVNAVYCYSAVGHNFAKISLLDFDHDFEPRRLPEGRRHFSFYNRSTLQLRWIFPSAGKCVHNFFQEVYDRSFLIWGNHHTVIWVDNWIQKSLWHCGDKI